MKIDQALSIIKDIANKYDLEIFVWPGKSPTVTGPAPIDETYQACVAFAKGEIKYKGPDPAILIGKIGVIHHSKFAAPYQWPHAIGTERPRLLFALFCSLAFPEPSVREMTKNYRLSDKAHLSDGFGWVRDRRGRLTKFPHYKGVEFGPDCDISPFAVIARGSLTDTEIGRGVKIDNFVHIAHGAKIGDHTSIAAGTVVEGSVKVGKRCTIGGNVTFQIGSSCGDDVTVGSGSVVTKHIPDGETWAGVPARKLK